MHCHPYLTVMSPDVPTATWLMYGWMLSSAFMIMG